MIFCVDDDNTIREIEVYTLEQTGFPARGFADGAALFAGLQQERPELIVLDIMLPGEDGIQLLKRLREHPQYGDIPVIMATAKGTEMDRITGLNQGADDYLVKPFSVMEMVARVKAVLRRTAKAQEGSLCVGAITLCEAQHRVFADGQEVPLTHKEFDILTLFLKNPELVFSREKLMAKVWGNDFIGESRTVDMHIKTLRQKLGAAGGQIKTVIGVGYRMEKQV